ncbi:MAG: serine/threonine protein kinase [Tannerella sp.]|jgi:serine/threonine protein kinase|nr:serine/threonine protein kinase [Tannerella sp.]
MRNKTIHGYTLKYRLGEGGMAEVWYAENSIGKPAAVKILKEEFIKMQPVVERFENEAKVMVNLDHLNIRQVNDFGTIDGRPCIIMEYLEGSDLSTRIKQGERFSMADLQKWWNILVDTLNYTHQQGIVHRDIKPSNIFLTDKADIKLLDFGIAKIRDSITATQTGSRMGTLIYMSPEQVKDSKNLDYRSDIYSLAVTFYHLLTGVVPYNNTNSSDFEIQSKIVNEPLQLDELPQEWATFLRPYLEKEPENRPELKRFDQPGNKKTDETEKETEILTGNQKAAKPSDAKNVKRKNIGKRVIVCLLLVIVAAGAIYTVGKRDNGDDWAGVEQHLYNASDSTVQVKREETNVETTANPNDVEFYKQKLERYYKDQESNDFSYIDELFAPQVKRLYNIKTTIDRDRVKEEGIKYAQYYKIRTYEIVDIKIVESTDEHTVINLTSKYTVRRSENHAQKSGTTKEVIVFNKNNQITEMYNNNTK